MHLGEETLADRHLRKAWKTSERFKESINFKHSSSILQIQITCCKYYNAQGIFKFHKEDEEENDLSQTNIQHLVYFVYIVDK